MRTFISSKTGSSRLADSGTLRTSVMLVPSVFLLCCHWLIFPPLGPFMVAELLSQLQEHTAMTMRISC